MAFTKLLDPTVSILLHKVEKVTQHFSLIAETNKTPFPNMDINELRGYESEVKLSLGEVHCVEPFKGGYHMVVGIHSTPVELVDDTANEVQGG